LVQAPSQYNTSGYPAPFLAPFGELLADYTASELNRPVDIAGIMPQVAAVDPFTQVAQGRMQHNKQDLELFNMILKEELLVLVKEQVLQHMNLFYNKLLHKFKQDQVVINNTCHHINKMLLMKQLRDKKNMEHSSNKI
jgi:hypothetical protein